MEALKKSILEVGLLDPIDILLVEGQYYGFSGAHLREWLLPPTDLQLHFATNCPPFHTAAALCCPGHAGCHRFQAHQELGKETILCRVRVANRQALRFHLM